MSEGKSSRHRRRIPARGRPGQAQRVVPRASGFAVTAARRAGARRRVFVEAGSGRDGLLLLPARQHLFPRRPPGDVNLRVAGLDALAARLKAATSR